MLFLLTVILLNGNILGVIMLTVIVLNVGAHFKDGEHEFEVVKKLLFKILGQLRKRLNKN